METGKKCPYDIPFDENGNPIPLKKQKVNGQDIPLPDPALEGQPHTVVGGRKSTTTGELHISMYFFMILTNITGIDQVQKHFG